MLEQKVWITTGSNLYPNLYVIIVGNPGIGKTRSIRAARDYLFEVPEFHLAPTSLTGAALVDVLTTSKRMIIRLPEEPLEYNSMMIASDEIGTFMHKYDDEMVAMLSAFYDNDVYGQWRRGKDIKIKMKAPQINLLCGSTPSNLMKLMPEGAWDQGFTSRLILIYSDQKIIGDDFAHTSRGRSDDLVHDLKIINSLVGRFDVTEDYAKLIYAWRQAGDSLTNAPQPSHPKLVHYNARRKTHLYKLSMVAAIDRSNTLLLTREDFNIAMQWLAEAEVFMPEIFKAGAGTADAQAMDEIYHFVLSGASAKGLSEHRIINFARERLPAHAVMTSLEIMERSGMIKAISIDPKTGLRNFIAVVHGGGLEVA